MENHCDLYNFIKSEGRKVVINFMGNHCDLIKSEGRRKICMTSSDVSQIFRLVEANTVSTVFTVLMREQVSLSRL